MDISKTNSKGWLPIKNSMIFRKSLEWRRWEGGATAYKTEGRISISFHLCPRNLILELISPGNRAMTLHKEANFTL